MGVMKRLYGNADLRTRAIENTRTATKKRNTCYAVCRTCGYEKRVDEIVFAFGKPPICCGGSPMLKLVKTYHCPECKSYHVGWIGQIGGPFTAFCEECMEEGPECKTSEKAIKCWKT